MRRSRSVAIVLSVGGDGNLGIMDTRTRYVLPPVAPEGSPVGPLLLTLLRLVGLPYLALSTTGPLMQAWYARFALGGAEGRDAYKLYAASNLGSLLALAACQKKSETAAATGDAPKKNVRRASR